MASQAAARYRNFATVFYPESVNFNDMKEFISMLHVPAFISPLHDQDKNPDGTEKKPHWHVLLMFDGKKSPDQIRELLSGSGSVGIEVVNTARGYARYLCHLDNPEKHKYEISEVVSLSGADYSDTIGLPIDNLKACRDMIDWCNKNCILAFDQLVDYCMNEKMDWFAVLHHGGIMIVKEYLKSKSWRLERKAEYERRLRDEAPSGDRPD